MKYFLLNLLLIGVLCFDLNAQTINNSSFESWTPSGKEPPFDWAEPTGWKSSNALTEWTGAGISKTTPAQKGSYAVKIRSVMISEGWYSVLCNGNPKLISDFSHPDIDIMTGGEPLPDNVQLPSEWGGYYKFNAKTAGDSAYAVLIMKKYNSNLQKYDTIALAGKMLGHATSFTQFSIPINYIKSVRADSFVIAFYSTNPKSPTKPADFSKLGELIIDNIYFGTQVGITEINKSFTKLIAYPNPAKNALTLEIPGYDLSGAEIHIAQMDGKQVFSKQILNTSTNKLQVDISGLKPGLYIVSLKNASSANLYYTKIQVE